MFVFLVLSVVINGRECALLRPTRCDHLTGFSSTLTSTLFRSQLAQQPAAQGCRQVIPTTKSFRRPIPPLLLQGSQRTRQIAAVFAISTFCILFVLRGRQSSPMAPGLTITGSRVKSSGESWDGPGISLAEVKAVAAIRGITLTVEELGPWYRVRLHVPRGEDSTESDVLVGETSGWAQPTGIVHLDSMQVRRHTGYWKRRGGQRRWVGALLGLATAAWALENSPFPCRRARLLAIRDDPAQHDALVRYYKLLGFEEVDLKDQSALGQVLQRLLYGGDGTLMEVDGPAYLTRWLPALRAETLL